MRPALQADGQRTKGVGSNLDGSIKHRKSFSLHLIANDHLKNRGLLPSGALSRTRYSLEQTKKWQRKQIIAYVRFYKLERSLDGYSHRERCHAPVRIHSTK